VTFEPIIRSWELSVHHLKFKQADFVFILKKNMDFVKVTLFVQAMAIFLVVILGHFAYNYCRLKDCICRDFQDFGVFRFPTLP
jgi:hypothetical protein